MKSVCLFLGLTLLTGCLSNTSITNVAVLSFGDLQGRSLQLPTGTSFELRRGEHSGNPAKLSCAVEDALAGTGCDTLMDAVITAKTSQFWFFGLTIGSSALEVEGKCVRSADLPKENDK